MGNFYKYNDKVGGGVSGLTTANAGDAIADNEIIRGDGTTGIQGGVLTSADHNGDISGPTASTDTTVAGSDFANQPSNDSITVVSSDAGDTGISVTLIGTTTGTDTVVVEVLPLDGTDATTPVVSAKLNWGQLLAVKVTGTTLGTLTLTETSGAQTITTMAPAATSKGVDTGSISCWNRIPYVVASGASTKQIGLKGTNSAGATIYDSQALTGATSLLVNSAFVTITEYYVGDLESTRTATITAQAGVGISTITGTSANGDVTIDPQGTGKLIVDNLSLTGNTIASTDTNGNINLTPNGTGQVIVPDGAAATPTIRFTTDATGIYRSGFNVGVSRAGTVQSLLGLGVQTASTNKYSWTPGAATDSADTALRRVAAGQVSVSNETNGQSTNIKTSATTVNLSGATSTATGLFPAKCIQLGVTVRVTTLAASGDGGTSMNIGDGSDADRYGATIAFAAGTTVNLSNATADPRGWSASAGDVVFTCVGGTFNAGVVRVVAHYIDLTASTS